jgi:hypothetical protein
LKNKVKERRVNGQIGDVRTFEGGFPFTALLFILLLIGFGIRFYISWMDIEKLFQKCLVDDAFFYFGIAKNIATGKGATFDGSIMTNGFHPIYALLLVPIFWLSPGNPGIPVHVALTILSVFNVLTGYVIFLILGKIAGRIAGLLGAFLWLFNPFVILIALSGVEVGVAAFFISLCIYVHLQGREEDRVSFSKMMLLGLLTALAVLSRVDAVFIFVAIALDLWYLSYRKGTSLFKSLSQAALYCFITLLLLSPWFLWNLYHFGTIRQISGVTLPNIAHNMYLMKYNTYLSLSFVKTELYHLKVWMENTIRYSGGIGLFVILFIFFAISARKNFVAETLGMFRKIKVLHFVLFSSIFLISFYALYFWGWLRSWYYLSVVLTVTIYLGNIGGYALEGFSRSRPERLKNAISTFILFLICAIYFSIQGLHIWQKGLFPFQKQLYESAVWLKENTPKNSKIGAISAGIYGYMNGRTIDLAGVVNEEAYRAMREKRIFNYLQEKQIDYLVDREDMILFYNNCFNETDFIKDLKLVKRFGNTPSDVVVYRISSDSK